jgi:hypothetical protein
MSTDFDYGVDMRGEVVLLTRNVKIAGVDNDSWGGHVLVSDVVDETGAEKNGWLTMENVQFEHMSQRDTEKAALRFDSAALGQSRVKNIVIADTLGWSVNIVRSSNIVIEDSAFIGAKQIGVAISVSRDVTLKGIITGDVMKRVDD